MTHEEYEIANDRILELWGCELNTPEAEEFERLCKAVEAYDDIHHVIPEPTKEAIIEFEKDQRG